MNGVSELVSMVTSDGIELKLDAYGGDLKFLVVGGFGLPPVSFVTHQGYQQVGASVIAPVAEPRSINAQMYRSRVCSREDYWQARNDILDFFRSNRGGPLILVVRLPDGSQRCLNVRADPGPIFPPNDPAGSAWNLQENLQFTAFDPIWYDPVPVEFDLSPITQSGLTFPITFPITFGFPGPVYSSGAVAYEGTWPAWMLMRLRGPFTWARIVNESTGAQILLKVSVPAGATRLIDLRNAPVITDENNVSRFSELGAETDLLRFPFAPPPASAQQIKAYLYNGTAESAFYLAYYRRFVGI